MSPKTASMYRPLFESDPDIAAAIDNEARRQHEGLELIASENFVSEAVLEAAGSVFTNKYAEGYPGKRYYGGCEFADVVENLARDRAKQLFGAEHANVQPHSGSQANAAAYMTLISTGDPIRGLDTGASSVVLTRDDAKKAGLPLEVLNYSVNIDTANGRARAAPVTLDRIAIGGLEERAIEALVAQPGQLKMSLLGMSFLNRLQSWQVSEDRLTLQGYP